MTFKNLGALIAILGTLLPGTGRGGPPSPPLSKLSFPTTGTVEMAARLKRLADECDPTLIPFGANDRRVRMLRELLKSVTGWKAELPLKFLLGNELLGDGRNGEMLACLDDIDATMA